MSSLAHPLPGHVPAAGGSAVLPGRERSQGGRRPQLPQRGAADVAGYFPDLDPALGTVRSDQGRLPVRREFWPGCRHSTSATTSASTAFSLFSRAAGDLADADLHPGELGIGEGSRQGIHGRVPCARDLHGRHVLRARPGAVLHLLRRRPDPDVPDHRCVGAASGASTRPSSSSSTRCSARC